MGIFTRLKIFIALFIPLLFLLYTATYIDGFGGFGGFGSFNNKNSPAGVTVSAYMDSQYISSVIDEGSILKNIYIPAGFFGENNILFSDKDDNIQYSTGILRKENSGKNVFISITNDKYYVSGQRSEKDPSLITSVLSTETSTDKHINEILNLANKGAFYGVAIDYERIRERDYRAFCKFIEKLHNRLDDNNMSLTVFLEYSFIKNGVALPEGPEYAVMTYNLYGSHTGPGPKTNKKLIEEIARLTEHMANKPSLVLSLGGFNWNEHGEARPITEKEAVALYEKEGIYPKRDAESKYMTFTYKDNNLNHSVWYADSAAAAYIMAAGTELGFTNYIFWGLEDAEDSFISELLIELENIGINI